ncbi:hypothetical protein [Treponema zioleckii]|uniref:hypothetical protein n=1 Tax=Treponema zioleckii TaxID=331680 RepID=UPI00168A6A42|nr:hypothetical protein [Treponema zioleckii]
MGEHIVFEQYTDMDKNIRVLAQVKAECLCHQYLNDCRVKCTNCSKYKKILDCYSQLATCDKLKCDHDADYIVGYLIRDRLQYKSIKLRTFATLLLFGTIIIFLLFICTGCLHAQTFNAFDKQSQEIWNILWRVQCKVHDCNLDGQINCIDYSLEFKKQWDKVFNPAYCEIVRNRNRDNGFNHLFVRVKSDNTCDYWIFVEPQATYGSYLMEDFWGDRYNFWKNIYGETNNWLRHYVQ